VSPRRRKARRHGDGGQDRLKGFTRFREGGTSGLRQGRSRFWFDSQRRFYDIDAEFRHQASVRFEEETYGAGRRCVNSDSDMDWQRSRETWHGFGAGHLYVDGNRNSGRDFRGSQRLTR